jgi:hypothetical protein
MTEQHWSASQKLSASYLPVAVHFPSFIKNIVFYTTNTLLKIMRIYTQAIYHV